MAGVIGAADLRKAVANLKRIEEFVLPRRQWKVDRSGYDSLLDLSRSAATIVRTLDPFLDAHGIPLNTSLQEPVEPLPVAQFDAIRLARLADFMDQLQRWFRDHADGGLEADAARHLGQVYDLVRTIAETAEAVLSRSPFHEKAPAEEVAPAVATPEPPAPERVALPGPTPAADGGPATEGVPHRGERLELEDTEAEPLLQTFEDDTELTPLTKERVAEFLERNQVVLTGYQLHKFESELQRRIEGTPLGQLLVVKIGNLQGQPRPFFSYQPKTREPVE